MKQQTPQSRLASLLDALLDGEISEADFLILEAELIVDPEARKSYYKRLQIDLLLSEAACESHIETDRDGNQHPAPTRPLVWQSMWLPGILIAIAASLLMIGMLPWWYEEPNTALRSEPPASEPSASGFAVLSGQSDAVWIGNPIANGALLPTGELHLASGLIHLELFSGVQMVIQGEANFSIDSPMQVSMRRGQARAHVPEPAHGFRIKTESGDVVDLGTEFTVDIDQHHSNIRVLDGEVELHPRDTESRRLRDGEALQLSTDGSVSSRVDEQLPLIGPDAFQDAIARRQSKQLLHWKVATDNLRQDPRLIAHYFVDPDRRWSRQLINRASSESRLDGEGVAGDGAVVVATPAKDRWGREGGALDFSRMGSRVRTVVPGEHAGLTLMCWVKINSLDRWFNSLFLTDGHEEREPHWQIMDDGRLFFSVKPASVEGLTPQQIEQQVYYSEPFWTTSMSGQWIMLATVYDVQQRQVSHYVNGNRISNQPIPDSLLVESIKIGPASICNWNEPMYRNDATFVVRNLNGSIDEFALFSGALSEHEISDLYHTGNPNEQ